MALNIAYQKEIQSFTLFFKRSGLWVSFAEKRDGKGTAIAEKIGVTETTLSKWRNLMEWDAKRDKIQSTPAKIRELLLTEMKSVSEGNKAKIDADALSKINKALSYLEGKVSLSVVISVFMEFDNWMAEVDPAEAVKLTVFHKQFINYRAEQDSLK